MMSEVGGDVETVMLRRLWAFATTRCREGAETSAIGILLNSLAILMQDTPGVPAKDATVMKAFNFVRIIEELQSIDISEPIVPAVQSLQVGRKLSRRLLLKVGCEGVNG